MKLFALAKSNRFFSLITLLFSLNKAQEGKGCPLAFFIPFLQKRTPLY